MGFRIHLSRDADPSWTEDSVSYGPSACGAHRGYWNEAEEVQIARHSRAELVDCQRCRRTPVFRALMSARAERTIA